MAKKEAGILSTFNKLRDKITGKGSNTQIDKIDLALNNISTAIMNKDSLNQAELIRSIFTGSIDSTTFNNFTSNFYLSYDNISRQIRYINGEEIVDNLPYCARALKVMADEIVSPNDITKDVLDFTEGKNPTDEERNAISEIRAIKNVLKMEDYLHDIVSETLKLGDQFVEICDYTSNDIPLTQSLLHENDKFLNETSLEEINKLVEREILSIEEIDVKIPVLREISTGKTIEEEKEIKVKPVVVEAVSSSRTDKVDIKNIRLIIHDPRFVIKLQSHRFKMNLGYLVIPRPSGSDNVNFFNPSAGNSNSCSGGFSGGISTFGHHREFTGVDRIYTEIITTIKKHINSNDDIAINKKEVKDLIFRAIKEFDEEARMEFRVRYVPPERMEHFTLPSRRFFPYGEGIFFKTTFQSKLLMAFETALVIKRVSDSSDKRAIYVETGLPRNVRNLIEDIKESLKKRKFSVGTMGNISSIPSMITSYEDYYIPQNKGKRYVEFDQLPSPVSLRDIADELRVFRDFLVSGLEVPPSYLNLEENLSNKSALTFENILFARTIISYQKRFSKYVNSLFSKIYKLTHGKLMPDFIKINFSPPALLQLERDTEHAETVTRLINSLAELGISKEYLKKKYLSIDWDEHDEYETQETLDKKSGGTSESEVDAMGGTFQQY